MTLCVYEIKSNIFYAVTAESWEDVECFETDTDTFQNQDSFPRANSFPRDKGDCVQIDAMALKDPIWVSPNIEVKIADLGNACWEVSFTT